MDKKGFTLIEMMVSVSIMTIITVLILFNYPRFNSKLALEATAGEVALSIREAQVYGAATKSFEGQSPSGYGIHFDISASGSDTSFILFADLLPIPIVDNIYTEEAEKVNEYTIQTKLQIYEICTNPGANCNIEVLDIVYNRPLLFALINDDLTISNATIKMKDNNDRKISVVVYKNGQISVVE